MQPRLAAGTTGAGALDDYRRAQRLLVDLLVVIVLVIPVIVCEFGIDPFRRGFFCVDESLRYPFRANTVTPVALGLLVGLLPLALLIIIEYVRCWRRGQTGDAVLLFDWRTPAWVVECVRQIWYYTIGLVLTLDATEVGKYTIGRLRPHFVAVCQPQLLDDSTCDDPVNRLRYVENYVCRAEGYTMEDVRQARLSFPSGHSSLACYAMVYLTLCFQQRIRWRGSRLLRHLLQFVLLVVAWYTALSRVMDNWHHWSDVLGGSLIGVICALLTGHYVARLFAASSPMRAAGSRSSAGVTSSGAMDSAMDNDLVLSGGGGLKLSLPRPDTTTTLQDVVISTPPPYTLGTVNSFNNEQYCTKV